MSDVPSFPKTPVGWEAFTTGVRCASIEGAKAYLDGNRHFVKDWVTKDRNLRAEAAKPDMAYILEDSNFIICVIAHVFSTLDPAYIRGKVPQEDFELFVGHMCDVMSAVAQSSQWKTGNGVLKDYDFYILYTAFQMTRIPGFNRAMLSTKNDRKTSACDVLAQLCRASTSGLTDKDQASHLVRLVAFIVDIGVWEEPVTRDHAYPVLEHLEASGILVEAFRAMVVPSGEEALEGEQGQTHQDYSLFLLSRVQREPRLLAKKINHDTHTGKVLLDIIDSNRCTFNLREPIVEALNRLFRASWEAAPNKKLDEDGCPLRTLACAECFKILEKPLTCSRCKVRNCEYCM